MQRKRNDPTAEALVTSEPSARESLFEPGSSAGAQNANAEVQQPAYNGYLQRKRDQPDGESEYSAEQLEHHADGEHPQQGEKANHEDGSQHFVLQNGDSYPYATPRLAVSEEAIS